jgi:GNAT superfamily N-acetyltransferase
MTEDGPVPVVVVNRGAVIPFSDDLLLSFVAVVGCIEPGEPHVVSVVTLLDMTAIGSIKWVVGKNSDCEISLIHVVQEYRRRGIATLLLEVANEVADREGWPRPEHSPTRTPDGDGWAQSRGAAPATEIDDSGSLGASIPAFWTRRG